MAEVKAMDEESEDFNTVCIFGYVFKLEKGLVGFNSHKGRDITNR